MATSTLTYVGQLVVTSCWCGIGLAIPDSLYQEASANHNKSVYCPLGHSFVYGGETEAQKERRLRKQAEDLAAVAGARADQAEASRRAWKGQVTKLRNRAAAGACPFCGQSVYQMARHVARKHAEEAGRELVEGDATA